MKYGVGITTRNRTECLKYSLLHFSKFKQKNVKYVVIDDCSDFGDNKEIVDSFKKEVQEEVIYLRSNKRLGVSNAKNACLYQLLDCDYVFLFDDDAWPIADDWADAWSFINDSAGVGHSMFNVVDNNILNTNPAYHRNVKTLSSIKDMSELENAFGVLLYFNRECLNAIGGFDPNPPHLYGYEHAQVSQRANRAGFTCSKKYLVPTKAHELIYSVDISYRMLGLLPPIDIPSLMSMGSAVSPEDRAKVGLNGILLNNPPTYIPLVNPLDE